MKGREGLGDTVPSFLGLTNGHRSTLRRPAEKGCRMSVDRSFTISEFCEAERISRAFLYKLWSQQKGPRFYYVGSVRRISHEARLEWHRQLEAWTKSGEATHRGEIPAIRIGKRIPVLRTALERTPESSR